MSDAPKTAEEQRAALRQILRSQRAALPDTSSALYSQQISERLHTLLNTLIRTSGTPPQHIAGYFPIQGEVDIRAALHTLHHQGIVTYVPIVLPDFALRFAPVTPDTPTHLNRYRIAEPQVPADRQQDSEVLDVVLVPLVGFDTACNRLGMGGGYYDRCFAHRHPGHADTAQRPLLIGVAYDMQCVPSVHPAAWDIPLDYVVTESTLYSQQGH